MVGLLDGLPPGVAIADADTDAAVVFVEVVDDEEDVEEADGIIGDC